MRPTRKMCRLRESYYYFKPNRASKKKIATIDKARITNSESNPILTPISHSNIYYETKQQPT